MSISGTGGRANLRNKALNIQETDIDFDPQGTGSGSETVMVEPMGSVGPEHNEAWRVWSIQLSVHVQHDDSIQAASTGAGAEVLGESGRAGIEVAEEANFSVPDDTFGPNDYEVSEDGVMIADHGPFVLANRDTNPAAKPSNNGIPFRAQSTVEFDDPYVMGPQADIYVNGAFASAWSTSNIVGDDEARAYVNMIIQYEPVDVEVVFG